MRILFVVEHFPSFSETFVLNEVTGLRDLGHDVTIYAVGMPSAPVEHPDVQKYDLKNRLIPNAPVPNAKMPRLLEALARLPAFAAKCGPKVAHALNPFLHGMKAANLSLYYSCLPLLGLEDAARFDAIHCHFGFKGVLALAWRRMGLVSGPISTVFHAHDLCTLSTTEARRTYGGLLASDTLLLPISERWRQRLIGWGAAPERTIVHHMGVDVQKFDFLLRTMTPGEPVRIVSVGRLVEQKGYEYAIRAIAELTRMTTREVSYTIIGTGDNAGNLEGPLRHLANELGIASVVTFAGAQPQDIVQRSLRDAHIFLLPSVTASDGLQEGIPVALMEAMASGLPVVTTRHSGIPELVEDGLSGFLADERAVTPLALAMARLVSEPGLAQTISTGGRAKVEADFNLRKLNLRLEQIFEEEMRRAA